MDVVCSFTWAASEYKQLYDLAFNFVWYNLYLLSGMWCLWGYEVITKLLSSNMVCGKG